MINDEHSRHVTELLKIIALGDKKVAWRWKRERLIEFGEDKKGKFGNLTEAMIPLFLHPELNDEEKLTLKGIRDYVFLLIKELKKFPEDSNQVPRIPFPISLN